MPTFQNTLSVSSSKAGKCRVKESFYTYPPMKMEQTVFRNVGT